jgi:hypothetical protein
MNDQFEQITTDETEQTTVDETPTPKLPWTTPVLRTVEVEETDGGKISGGEGGGSLGPAS